MSSGRRLGSIQILRAIAAFLVVLQHGYQGTEATGDFFSRFGFTGVDLFFIISGFIFAYQAGRGKFRIRSFVENRVRRIYPAYWCLLPIVLVFWLGDVGHYWEFSELKTWPLVKSILLIPQPTGRLYTVGWTLEIEFLFYTVFAILCSLGRARWLVPVLYAIGLVSLIFPQIYANIPSRFYLWDYPYTFMFFVEFATGAIICQLQLRAEKLGWKIPLALGLVAYAMFVYLFCSAPSAYEYNFTRLVGMSFAFALIMIASLNAERLGLLESRTAMLMVFGGEASYSIYLVHSLIYWGAGYLVNRAGFTDVFAVGAPAIFYRIVTIVLAVGLSVLYYLLVERPITRALQSESRFAKS